MKNVNFVFKRFLITMIIASVASSACAAKKVVTKQKESVTSDYFVSFDKAEYHTSPDKRIGAKILVDSTKVGPTIAALSHLTYLPGAHVQSHRHVYSTELLYVLSGFLTVKIGNETNVVGPNCSVYIPSGTYHEYLNDSIDVVKFLQFYSPAAPEEEYRKWEKPNNDSEKKKAEAAKIVPEVSRVVAPSMPLVPGSPKMKVGEVVSPEPSELDKLRERLKKSIANTKN